MLYVSKKHASAAFFSIQISYKEKLEPEVQAVRLFEIYGFQSAIVNSYISFVFIKVHLCSVAISWFDCCYILLDSPDSI